MELLKPEGAVLLISILLGLSAAGTIPAVQ